jgi:putative transposase
MEPNQVWAMDFMHDTLADGSKIRVLTAIDVATRECVARSLPKDSAAPMWRGILSEARSHRGELPKQVRVDNGRNYVEGVRSLGLLELASSFDFQLTGKTGRDNAFIEASTGR